MKICESSCNVEMSDDQINIGNLRRYDDVKEIKTDLCQGNVKIIG